MIDTLYIVVPCYNEQEVLPETSKQLLKKLNLLKEKKEVSKQSRILFVDDGSKDNTWSIISTLHYKNSDNFSALRLSKNCGHQNALHAGLMSAKSKADFTISIDADLQDDINAMDEMIEKYYQGFQIVYGVRSDRTSDSKFKRESAQGFYKFMKFLGVDIVYNHADYRLLSKEVLNHLAEFNEAHLFLRGMIPLIGYKSDTVEYKRRKRYAGETKYSFRKMLELAWNAVTSFSIKPIRLVTLLGVICLAITLIIVIFAVISTIFKFTNFSRYGVLISIWLLGSLNLLAVGLVGEYIGKNYFETKKRPLYFIENILDK